ncbi:MAG: VWA domain-containing protein, partial [Oceanisphaera sp.]|uniref:VWA domain-containing protein n=1 Tax=Oceanisphaera sp. TaxID=1929979 RepID=UPI003F9E75D2
MKLKKCVLTSMLLAGSLACSTMAQADEDVVIVYDASGSMWGQIDGVSKIEIAREVMADLINNWDHNTHLGLVAYGHRRQGDCSDIETLIAPKKLDKASFIQTVNNIRPNGKTPISASLQHAADLLSYRDSQATIVLISDGLETCHADPCALSAQLAKQGVKLTTHVVGFDLDKETHASLSCIADNTGGIFVPANNAAELHAALDKVQSAMIKQPEPEPEPTPPEVEIFGPEQVTTGALFDVSWSNTINERDFITIVPANADANRHKNHIRTKNNTGGRLTAPGESGLYELRYVLEAGRKVLASAPIEVVSAEVGISGPSVVRAGSSIDARWSSTINSRDFITLAPMGAEENYLKHHIRTKNKREGRLSAPDAIGLYELRYVLEASRQVLARASVEVVGANAPLDYGAGLVVPESATAGEVITIRWTGTFDSGDQRIALALKDKPDFSWLNVQSVGDDKTMTLTLPDKAGVYEVRFLDVAGRKLLGRSVI